MSLRYTIRTAASKTGLSAHTIRAWERRYGALSPDRTDSNRRLYEEEDLERLALLRLAVESGHSIGQVAQLPTEDLRRFAVPVPSEPHPPQVRIDRQSSITYLKAAEQAIEDLDPDALSNAFRRGAASLGVSALVEDVVLPLMDRVGRRWEEGSLSIAQEHMASAVTRTHLEQLRGSLAAPTFAPRMLVTTPVGQIHEIGALAVAIVATMQGWHVTYLGANLPAAEIAAAVRLSGARAVGLSLVYPLDDPGLGAELMELRERVGPTIAIIVGGRAAHAYAGAIEGIGAQRVESLAELRDFLDQIRGPG